MRDVTLQKKLEEQFYQSQKMESIGTLAGGIAHDFNNLLMGIQGNVSVMNLEVGAADPLQESIDSIARCVKSGSQLTNQLLAFARGGKYVVTPSNLNTIVHKTAEIFGRTKKEIDLHPVFAKDIWPVEVDPSQIEQVLMNLYVNARQAMPEGGDLYIELENVRLDEHYCAHQTLQHPTRAICQTVGDGHRRGDDSRHPEAHLRALFFHQGKGNGHRVGPGVGLRHHQKSQRVYQLLQ